MFELISLPTVRYVEEDLNDVPSRHHSASLDDVVMGGTEGGIFPGGSLEINLAPEGHGVQELQMENPNIQSISLA